MQLWQAIVLGAVQGATEFFPVSSSGHLALAQNLMGLEGNLLAFDVALHVGTLVAVVLAMWPDLRGIVADVVTLRRDGPGMRLFGWIVLATIPAGVVGLLFNDLVESALSDPSLVALFLIITGGLLLWARSMVKRSRDLAQLGVRDAAVIGIAQAFALFPGISRSGATIIAGIAAGLKPAAAARFSFLLAIPTILGAALLSAKDFTGGGLGVSALVGGLTAAIVGYFAARWLLKALGSQDGRPLAFFGFYTIAVGGVWLVAHLL